MRSTTQIDYSQFGEQRLILDFLARQPGTYAQFCVDAGAFDGTTGSNTRALFEQGWRGIAIEPNPRSFARLRELYARRADIVCVQVALSDAPRRAAPMQFSIGPAGVPAQDEWQYGQVSTLNDAFADSYRRSHGYRYETVQVEVTTLTAVLERHRAPSRFGLLSVDCEGEDVRILQEFDFGRYRPFLVCVECDDEHRAMYTDVLAPRGYHAVAHTVSNTMFAEPNA